MLRIFVGYDPAEAVAYHVLCHSILKRASMPVSFTPINKRNLPEFTRAKQDGSTEFSFSRFLTPYLAGYQGQALFLDCDMLVRCDIYDLFRAADLRHAVHVVKHDYTPKTTTKFLGHAQHAYPRKNWSSVMLFNANLCKALTPDVVNTASGAYLHRFDWCRDDQIGTLPPEFNHLVGEYDPNPRAKIVHFTLGTPCFKGYERQEFAADWFAERESMLHAD
jgi:hypothetical protein